MRISRTIPPATRPRRFCAELRARPSPTIAEGPFTLASGP
ncbi:hypothetical protein FHR33_001467 [Nonomuraea dietziae]|uniref:Uncharacterized protein n=1 Tax=Nonomuraea dietziae TaxID=65515 RepID=A0A7W5UVS8_9ACTN|nr:hypothetical protein [Nonomuraea dietziae]